MTLPAASPAILRRHLGEYFDSIVAEMRAVDFKHLKVELAKIPHDEAAHRRNEAIKAKLAEEARTLPVPQDDEEAAILERHGFISPARAAKLDAGAL